MSTMQGAVRQSIQRKGINTEAAKERLLRLVSKDSATGCWDFIGHRNSSGYGLFVYGRGIRRAHRVSYELHIGPIASGLDLHHTCGNRSCCNFEHTIPITPSIHAKLSQNSITYKNSRKTHCPAGHELTDSNLDSWHMRKGRRKCKVCERNRAEMRNRAKGILPRMGSPF